MTWKDGAKQIIREVIAGNPGKDEKELRKLISAAYPWHPRTNHPYKAWCQAVKEIFAERTLYGTPVKPAKPATVGDYADTPLFMEATTCAP